jgi:osmotically-inducible protein OsmY
MDRYLIDAQVQLHVRAQLDWEPALSDTHIDVRVHDGVAALSGRVNSCLQRWAAQSAAERVSGVRSVTSEIGVALSESSRRSDADIARSAQNMLLWITSLPTGCIQAVVDDGWITLFGSVHWDYQKQAAAAAVRFVVGATGVTDRITLDAVGLPPAKRSDNPQETI